MPKKIEVREGDILHVRLKVTRVAEDALGNTVVTVQLPSQKATDTINSFDVVKVEKGNG